MNVLISNNDLEGVIAVLSNANARIKQEQQPRSGLLLLTIRKIIADVAAPYKEYDDLLPQLKEQYLATDEEGNYLQSPDDPGAMQCKSDQAAKEFADVMNEYNTITLRRWLTEDDLEQLPLLPDELNYVLMVTKGEALTPDQLEQKEPEVEDEPKNEEE